MPQMMPWDTLPLFRVVETTFTTVPGEFIQVAAADPSRVGILFGDPNGNVGVVISTQPNGSPGTAGLILGKQAGNPFTLYNSFAGALTQVAWFAGASAPGALVTVVELFLAHDPCAKTNDMPIVNNDEANNGQSEPESIASVPEWSGEDVSDPSPR